MTTTTLDGLAAEIRSRLDGIDTRISDSVSDVRLTDLIKSNLEAVLSDDSEWTRKLKFAAQAPALVGTKYARAGLSVADVEFLFDTLRAAQEIGLSKRGPSEELSRTFEAISAGRYMSTAMARAEDERRLRDLHAAGHMTRGQYHAAVRAMDTGEAGYGAELDGAQYVGELWEAARRESRVFALLPSFELTQATAYIPVEADLPEMLFVSENTSATASDYSTSKSGSNVVQVTPKKFIVHQMWSGELEEDSIIPFVPFLRRQATLSLAHYSDSLVLNGDTTNAATGNINLDDADPADTKHYLAFDGIRHAWIVDVTTNGVDAAGAVTLAQLNSLRGKMMSLTYLHDWGHPTNPEDLVYVSDPETADRIAMLDEIVTVDKYGPQAGVLTGEAAKIAGHSLVRSIAMSKTEADGKVSTTASNNIKGQVTAFNRRGFIAGWRRRVMVEAERLPGRDQTRLIYSLRLGMGRFTPTGNANAIEAASGLYNISL